MIRQDYSVRQPFRHVLEPYKLSFIPVYEEDTGAKNVVDYSIRFKMRTIEVDNKFKMSKEIEEPGVVETLAQTGRSNKGGCVFSFANQ